MKFRKKPVVIEAVQWQPGVHVEGVQEIVGDPGDGSTVSYGYGMINTLEGPLRVSPGDWIITGVKGERYPCKPDIFEATYEPAPVECRTHVFVSGLRRCRKCGLEIEIGDGV